MGEELPQPVDPNKVDSFDTPSAPSEAARKLGIVPNNTGAPYESPKATSLGVAESTDEIAG
ncbi:hypothetical protein A3B57_03025 [Microgenomates group bacterium RIFCSPLOWO2_01_FULL_47_10]|nr:MAG: hypothetical protein A3B57_03025 [Microgenomates group bacterium RIFCSPLOWO2_01_FULL_47_10]